MVQYLSQQNFTDISRKNVPKIVPSFELFVFHEHCDIVVSIIPVKSMQCVMDWVLSLEGIPCRHRFGSCLNNPWVLLWVRLGLETPKSKFCDVSRDFAVHLVWVKPFNHRKDVQNLNSQIHLNEPSQSSLSLEGDRNRWSVWMDKQFHPLYTVNVIIYASWDYT